jgi:hypothetical protein
MEILHKKSNYALDLTIISALAAIYTMVAVSFGYYPPANAAVFMAALSTLISAASLSIMIITTTNQQRNKDSRTSLESKGSTGSTKTE